MKKVVIMLACLGLLTVISCGGSSGGDGGDAEQKAETSFDAFAAVFEQCIPTAQVIDTDIVSLFPGAKWVDLEVEKAVQQLCACPGGGTVSLDTDTEMITISQCKSDTGLTYDGTITIDNNDNVNATMPQFGECTNATASNIPTDDTCGGTTSITCSGTTINCNVVDSDTADECDLDC